MGCALRKFTQDSRVPAAAALHDVGRGAWACLPAGTCCASLPAPPHRFTSSSPVLRDVCGQQINDSVWSL